MFVWAPVLGALIMGSGGFAKQYKNGDQVTVLMGTVHPAGNPSETYPYFRKVPICDEAGAKTSKLSWGQHIVGRHMVKSRYDITARVPGEEPELFNGRWTKLCSQTLDNARREQLLETIGLDSQAHVEIDGLMVNFPIGRLFPPTRQCRSGAVVFTRHNFKLYTLVSKDGTTGTIVDVKIEADTGVCLEESVPVFVMKYSAEWHRVDRPPTRVLEVAHWNGLVVFAVVVAIQVVLVAALLWHILLRDIARYALDDTLGDMTTLDEYGWKLIAGDVFRFPRLRSPLSAIIGTGVQLGTVVILVLLLGWTHAFNSEANAVNVFIGIYAVSSCVSGYISSYSYKNFGGQKWISNILLTSIAFPLPVTLIWCVTNSVAWAHQTTHALPATMVLLILLLWIFVGFPLHVVGAVFGKNMASGFDAPVRTKHIPREILRQPWYRQRVATAIIGGWVPLVCIIFELDLVMDVVWNHAQHELFGVLLLFCAILALSVVCLSLLLTYLQLSGEDHRWWWRSISNAGSVGGALMVYATYYYMYKTRMHGLVQFMEFFGSMLLVALSLFTMCGSIGYFTSLAFVRSMYTNLPVKD